MCGKLVKLLRTGGKILDLRTEIARRIANFDMFKAWQAFYQQWQQQEATSHTSGESFVGRESLGATAVAEASESVTSLEQGAEVQANEGTGEP